MSRYLTLLGVALIVFSFAVGTIGISTSYSEYKSRLHVTGEPGSNPLTVIDEARWQISRVLGSAVIAGGLIMGSLLLGFAWVGRTMEQVRDALLGQLVEAEESIGKPKAASAD